MLTDQNEINRKFEEFNRQLLHSTVVPGASGGKNPLIRYGKKPKYNRAKNLSSLNQPKSILLSQEHRSGQKAFIDRILEIKKQRKLSKLTEL